LACQPDFPAIPVDEISKLSKHLVLTARHNFQGTESIRNQEWPNRIRSRGEVWGGHMKKGILARKIIVITALVPFSSLVFAQHDPGVRGGIQNTGGGLQQQGIPI